MNVGIWEVLAIGIVALVFFGPSRLPQMGKSVGEAIRGFKKGLSDIDEPAKPEKREQVASSEETTSTTGTREKTREPSDS